MRQKQSADCRVRQTSISDLHATIANSITDLMLRLPIRGAIVELAVRDHRFATSRAMVSCFGCLVGVAQVLRKDNGPAVRRPASQRARCRHPQQFAQTQIPHIRMV